MPSKVPELVRALQRAQTMLPDLLRRAQKAERELAAARTAPDAYVTKLERTGARQKLQLDRAQAEIRRLTERIGDALKLIDQYEDAELHAPSDELRRALLRP